MVWDTPWFVGQPAKHSAETARTLAFVATGGAEGVAQPGDLKVVPTPTPSGQLLVSIGGALMPARQPSMYEQSYIAANRTPDTVAPAATGSTGAQSDLIVCRVEDINGAGGTAWAANGADPTDGPFVYSRVIPNVPTGTTRLQDVVGHESDTGFALARLDKPANTGTFTAAMLTDLRQLARPRETTKTLDDLGKTTGKLTQTVDTLFPPFQPSVLVPSWATHMRVDATISQLSAAGSSTGSANLQVRASNGTTVALAGTSMSYNADASVSSTRFVHLATVFGDIRAYRGQNVKPSMFMRKTAAGQGDLTYDAGSQCIYRVTFYEQVV